MADDSPEAPARALERAGKLKKQQQQEDVAVDVAALEAEDDRDDPQRVWARVQSNLEELTHLAQKRREGATRSRASIIEELAADLSSYYEFLRAHLPIPRRDGLLSQEEIQAKHVEIAAENGTLERHRKSFYWKAEPGSPQETRS